MTPDLLWHLLLALAAVVVAGRVLGALFRFFGQPPVIGEVVAGIVLGPSLLGAVSPEAYTFLLPPTVAPSLGMLAQLGVVLYMFLVGVELDSEGLNGQLHTTIGIALTSIAVPFVLGAWLASALYPALSPQGVPFMHFMLFLGIAMSITAFPVLARILADRGITRTPLGRLALSCAAIDDVTAWCLLAFVVGVVQQQREQRCADGGADAGLRGVHVPGREAGGSPAIETAGDRDEPDRSVVAIVLVAVLVLGAGHGGDRHPRDLRRLSAGRCHSTRQPAGPCAERADRRPGHDSAAAGVLRLHRDADGVRARLGRGTTG